MDGAKLSDLISQRHAILAELLAISRPQIEAIAAGRMRELMSHLAAKQAPLNRLAEISELLRGAAGEDAQSRHWESQQAREKCRREQEECEQMHVELLAIEAHCETALMASRESLQQELGRVDAAQQAATSYADSGASPTAGVRLDLSSD